METKETCYGELYHTTIHTLTVKKTVHINRTFYDLKKTNSISPYYYKEEIHLQIKTNKFLKKK